MNGLMLVIVTAVSIVIIALVGLALYDVGVARQLNETLGPDAAAPHAAGEVADPHGIRVSRALVIARKQ